MRVVGKISYFGGPNDPQDNGQTASGIPHTVAGLAVYNQHTLGGYWFLKDPKTGRGHVLRQIDIGPHPDTGRKFDFNPLAAHKFGWRASNSGFPTDREMEGVYLGKDRNTAIARANRLKAPQPARAIDRWPATNLGGIPLRTVAQALAALQQ